MKSKIPFFLPVLALSLAAGSLARAEDAKDSKDSNMITVQPPAADAPASPSGKKGGRDGGRMAEERINQLDKALSLTADQKQKIKDIFAKEAADLKGLSPEERRSKGRDAMKAVHDQVRAVLTPEQQTKFDAMPKPGRAARKGKAKKAE